MKCNSKLHKGSTIVTRSKFKKNLKNNQNVFKAIHMQYKILTLNTIRLIISFIIVFSNIALSTVNTNYL